MAKNEIHADLIEKLLEALPKENRRQFEKILLQASCVKPLEIIHTWVDMFEDDCPVDAIIARICMQVITGVGGGIADDIKFRGESGKGYNGTLAVKVAIKELRDIADILEKQAVECQSQPCKAH